MNDEQKIISILCDADLRSELENLEIKSSYYLVHEIHEGYLLYIASKEHHKRMVSRILSEMKVGE